MRRVALLGLIGFIVVGCAKRTRYLQREGTDGVGATTGSTPSAGGAGSTDGGSAEADASVGAAATRGVGDDGATSASSTDQGAGGTGAAGSRVSCGNGMLEPGEECDGDQACSVDCKVVA